MASKTVNLSEDAYNRLNSLKHEGESFPDVINRLTSKYAPLDLVGILTEDEAEETRDRIHKLRERMRVGMQTSGRRLT